MRINTIYYDQDSSKSSIFNLQSSITSGQDSEVRSQNSESRTQNPGPFKSSIINSAVVAKATMAKSARQSSITIGGLQKSSLIDYPGKISCVLFLSGCNFACPYCHNPDLARGCLAANISENSVYDFLESRREFLDGVVITGGEPTIQKDLIQLCRKIKQMGYPVKLDTNGSRPWVVQTLIDEGLVDYIAMDIKTDPARYSSLIQKNVPRSAGENIIASIRIIIEAKTDYEFRTTCIRPFIDADVIESISRLISGAKLYALQKFQNTGVLQPEFFHGHEYGYSDDELIHLKSIAKPWVKRCIVR